MTGFWGGGLFALHPCGAPKRPILNRDFLTKSSLHKNCPYSELFWFVFPLIWTEYGEILKHTQTILRQKPTSCWSVFDHFVRLALKGLKKNQNYRFVD